MAGALRARTLQLVFKMHLGAECRSREVQPAENARAWPREERCPEETGDTLCVGARRPALLTESSIQCNPYSLLRSQQVLLVESDRLILNLARKCKGPRMIKTTLRKQKEEVRV